MSRSATGLFGIVGAVVGALLLGAGDFAPAGASAGEASKVVAEAREVFGVVPPKMPGSEKDTPEKVELGRKLYFETSLSINRTQSCNDCHRIDEDRAGVDNLPTSEGAKGDFGDRNSPTVLNAGFHVAQFWDGRAEDLAAQAKGPVLNPVEMAMPSEPVVLERIKALDYAGMFRKVFAGEDDPFTYDNVAEAIAAFERTLVTHDRFDDFLGGNEKALAPKEIEGLALFLDTGCADCHAGPLLGGDLYEEIGEYHPYKNRKDLGRFAVTNDEDDKYVFKVPSLRNVTLTAPYFHDGQVATIAEAVDLMGWLQLDEKLSNRQIDLLLRFLVSLNDKARTTAPAPKAPQPNWTAPDIEGMPEGQAGEAIRYGFQLLDDTYRYLGAGADDPAKLYSGNGIACRHCHQDLGTKPYGLPLLAAAQRYPRYLSRVDREISLRDRINGCMQRSMAGRPLPENGEEMNAFVAFLTWLGSDAPKDFVGRASVNVKIPNRAADVDAGRERYLVVCQSCHGADGAGYRSIGSGAKGSYAVPPLWGADSFNTGASMHRVLASASFIKSNMPLGTPWDRPHLTDGQAIDVAAYMNSQPRPEKAGLENDWPDPSKKPVDCPYPPYADDFPQKQHKYGPFPPIVQAQKKPSR